MAVALPALSAVALAALARASVREGGGWEGFPALVWRQDHRDRPVPPELLEGLGGVNVEGAWEDPELRARGVDFYVGHAPGRDALHLERDSPGYAELFQRFWDERDPAVLVRQPCLTDPRTRADLSRQLARSLAARGGDTGLGVSLGDEVSLTPWGDPLDLCASPTCQAAWEAFSRQRTGRALPLPSTDDARLRWSRGDPSGLGPWLLRREFHHQVVSDLLADLAAEAHAASAPVGLLGLSGRTAFGGVAVDRVLEWADFAEAYPTVDARALLYTLRGPEQHALATVFPERAGPDGTAWQIWEGWARGTDGIVVWSDRHLARPDWRRRVVAAVAGVRAARCELARGGVVWRPTPTGVALVHSWRSVAAGWLRDALLDGATWPKRRQGYQVEHGTWETSARGWLRLLEDAGAMPGVVPIERVSGATATRFPLLVLAHQFVLSDGELERLEAFLQAGGRLWIQGELGTLTETGSRREEDLVARLRRHGAERVQSGAPDAAGYLSLRRRGAPRAAELRRLAARRVAEAGGALAPVEGTSAGPLAVTWCRGASGAVALAWLPNLPTPEERASTLAPWTLSVDLPEGARARWLHPEAPEGAARVRVPAGDAAVLFLDP